MSERRDEGWLQQRWWEFVAATNRRGWVIWLFALAAVALIITLWVMHPDAI
jgi:hypothetical protein